MSQWTDAKVRGPRPVGSTDEPEVNLCRFHDNGDVGVTVNDVVYEEGKNVFPAQAFVNALWDLYPDGLPPKVLLSKEEKRIREVATYLLNLRHLIQRTYEEAVQDLDPDTVENAREDAKALIALVLDGDE